MYVIENFDRQKKILVCILLLTSFTSTHTYTRVFSKLVQEKKIRIKDSIVSFYAMEDKEYADMCDFQFFAHNYKETFFFKYLAK